jgi:hypothetical protein
MWTKDDCINAIRDLADQFPDAVITRNFFRNNSDCSEYWWSKYFGTFSEFKKYSGLDRTRDQTKLLGQVAKHASKDTAREFNKEKAEYEGKYLRPDSKRFQTIVTISDTHDISFDPFTKRVYLDTLKRIQPEVIVFGGDHFDLPEFSKYFNDPRSFNVIERINSVHDFLRDIREIVPDAEFNWISANHEMRLLKHLSEASPNMMVLLSDLHGFTISKLLGLDEFEINYISREDLGVFNESDFKKELGKNYLVKFDSVMFHHYPEGKHYGIPGMNGHHHKHKSDSLHNLAFGSYEWHQLGAGHIRRANYCDAQKWSTGFMISHHDIYNKTTVFEYVDTTRDFAVVGGKWYQRTDEEIYKV